MAKGDLITSDWAIEYRGLLLAGEGEIAMVESERVRVVLRAAGLRVDDAEGFVTGDAGGHAHRGVRLTAAAGAGEPDQQADVLAHGGTEGESHATS